MSNQTDSSDVMPDAITSKTYLTVSDVARQLQVTRATIYGWIFRRILPHVKVGRFVRVDPDDLLKFLQLRRRGDFSTIVNGRTQTRPEGW